MSDMHDAEESRQLLMRYQSGDEQAAEIIFHRYLQRLVRLARAHLSEKLRQRVDQEDIVQSVFRSFFNKAKEDRYTLERAGDLWRLLATITKHKVLKKAEHHNQQKRSLTSEQPLANDQDLNTPEVLAVEPTEIEGLELADEVQRFMTQIAPLQRSMLELRLQDRSVPEIARTVERSERTVRRFLRDIQAQLQDRLRELRE